MTSAAAPPRGQAVTETLVLTWLLVVSVLLLTEIELGEADGKETVLELFLAGCRISSESVRWILSVPIP